MDALTQAAARGDAQAMEAVVRMHYASVYRFCVRRVGADAAQDVAQETFLTAHKQLRHFDGRSSLPTWLLGIAHNHCRNLARKRKPELTFEDEWTRIEEMDTRSKADSEKTLIDREALRCALKALSPEHREVVVLHEVEGHTYEEAALILGVPVGTVKSRLFHAFLRLRTALAGAEGVTA
jgi:RNA polymerase sigma-70 factor (ECF subfamily)